MEAILENIIELAEKLWLRLDLLLDLENLEVPDLLKPYLDPILSDPLLLALTAAVLVIVPYGIYKIKQARSEKEKHLDELMNELDENEESDEEVTNKPLFPNEKPQPATGYDEPDVSILSRLEEGETAEEEDSAVQGLGLGEKDEPDDGLHPVYRAGKNGMEESVEDDGVYGNEFESSASSETNAPSSDADDLDQTLREIMGDDFNWEEASTTVSSELAEDGISEEDLKDQAILDLQAEMEESIEELSQSLTQEIGAPLTESETEKPESEILAELEEEIAEETAPEAEEEMPSPLAELEEEPVTEMTAEPEMEEEELDLLQEMESEEKEDEIEFHFEEEETVPEAKEEAPSPPAKLETEETESPEREMPVEEPLMEIADFLDIEPPEETEETETPSVAFIEPSSEISLEQEPAEVSELEVSPEPVAPEPVSPEPEILFKEPPDIPEPPAVPVPEITAEPEPEPQPVAPEPALEPEPATARASAGPLLKSMLDTSVSAKTDALVSRLKSFQAQLETRFHTLEPEPGPKRETQATRSFRRERSTYQPVKVSYRSPTKTRSKKEYLDLLESFIFKAKQKKK